MRLCPDDLGRNGADARDGGFIGRDEQIDVVGRAHQAVTGRAATGRSGAGRGPGPRWPGPGRAARSAADFARELTACASLRRPLMARESIRFDRGTLELGPDAPEIPRALWDPRTETRRAAALHFHHLAAAADVANRTLDGDLRHGWKREPREVAALELRPYQAQALASWNAFSQRGVIALPTGAGKTRIAIAAVFETGLPAAILCPTKALAQAWVEELRRHLPGQEIGLVGDGRRSVERVTVLTFESAYRHMDALGDRFGLIVVDEAHHFGSGARIEALEASAAIGRASKGCSSRIGRTPGSSSSPRRSAPRPSSASGTTSRSCRRSSLDRPTSRRSCVRTCDRSFGTRSSWG